MMVAPACDPAGVSQPGSSGRTAAAVLLAVMLLTIIGASVGYVLGAREARARAAAGTQPPGDERPTARPTTKAPTAGASTTGAPAPEACLDHTEQLARAAGSPGGLTVVLYVKTTGSEVWVCKDTDGRLWYQGHVRSDAEKASGTRGPLVEGDNALFLATVEREDEGYVATNRVGDAVTRYHMSARMFLIEHSDGRREPQTVLESRPGR
jgi:hypothetical protein